MFKIFDGREHFYQWDIDRKLILSDQTITEVHFCNKTDDCSLVCEVYEQDGLRLVNVPNILLQESWDIRAYAYCGSCYTKQSARYKVIARSKPADYVYTETEVLNWEAMQRYVEDATTKALEGITGLTEGVADKIVSNASGEIVALTDSANAPIESLAIYGKTTQAAEPTPETPQELVSAGADGDIKVNITRKNLCYNTFLKIGENFRGILWEQREDGSIVANGTATSDSYCNNANNYISKGTYTFSGSPAGASWNTYFMYFSFKDLNGNQLFSKGVMEKPETITLDKDCLLDISINIHAEIPVSNLVFKPQIEVGTVATEYEPYQEPTVMTISTPIALNGIPVNKDGNFTDASGQQWVTDEIDFERGVRIQRIGIHTVTDANQLRMSTCIEYKDSGAYYFNHYISKLNGNYTAMCNFYKHTLMAKYDAPNYVFNGAGVNDFVYFSGAVADLGEYTDIRVAVKNYLGKFISAENPMIVYYVLLEPIETPLTEAELVAYQEYYTNYPNTTIYSDDGVFLNIKYKADTKHYIDNKFNSLEKAILSLGGNI